MKFTRGAVLAESLPSGKREALVFDDDVPGFGLRIREGGSRSFIFQYKLGTKQRRMALGAATAVNLADLRKTAEKLYARVKLGQDPASDKARAQAQAVHTFKAAAGKYLEQCRARLRERTYPDLERHLLKHAKTLHELQLARISRADIAAVITSVSKDSGQVTSNRARTSLSGLFTWAMEQGFVETNPVVGTARHKEQSRDRVLAPDELRLIWKASGDDDFGAILKLLALTGQRAGEIAGLRWSEIADDTIVLPGGRTKNHRAHLVPLSQVALDIIAKQPRRATEPGELRDLIFGRYTGSGTFSGWSRSKGKLDAKVAEANGGKAIPHWTPHDLRRSFATHAGDLGIQPHIIEAALNHSSGFRAGVAGTYNRNSYQREVRIALDRWADHLMAIVEGRASNVTPLRREA
jgi:integrase